MSTFLRLTVVAASALTPALALAQELHYTETFIGFQTDCDGNPTPGTFNATGYKQVDSALYAPCGLLSASSGGSFGDQQLWDPLGIPVISQEPFGLEGTVAFCGAFFSGGFTFGDVELVFQPPVNEVAFDVLEMANATGLKVDFLSDAGQPITGTQNPTASNEMVHVEFAPADPTVKIAKVVLDYTPSGIDGWFVDSLRFNAFHCGDGETENGEECDDGNTVDCDGCGNDCKVTINGCKTATGCVMNGAAEPGSSGCNACDVSKREAGSDVGYTPVGAGTACPEDQFCLLDEACDGEGACMGMVNDCGDELDCTIDRCDEATDACNHTVGSGCLVDGSCRATGDRNPDAPCEACDPAANNAGWSTLTMGETCGAPSCSEGELTPAPICDEDGECVSGGEPVACKGFVCADPLSCVTECIEDDDCLEEFYCEDGKCHPDHPPSAVCTTDAQCTTGHCADGVCCDRACDSTCETCKAAGAVGMCRDVEVGTDPENECAGAGVCNGANECVSYETRGNGVCAVPQRPTEGHGAELLCLVACGGLLLVQRRRKSP